MKGSNIFLNRFVTHAIVKFFININGKLYFTRLDLGRKFMYDDGEEMHPKQKVIYQISLIYLFC